jgi:DNA-binding LacI/PurR family transcriptional regulator
MHETDGIAGEASRTVGPLRSTVRTISDRAGVSTSTVSRALKGDSRISAKTRDSILAIAREEGYTPNAMARSLVTRRSGVVGLVIGEIGNPFYPELLERLHLRLAARSLRPMLLHIGTGPLDEGTVQTLLQYQMDGCLIASATLSSRIEDICLQYRVPMVMINRVARVHSCAVSCNNFAGARLLGGLLIEAGHKRVALVTGQSNTSISEDRAEGLQAALSDHGLSLITSCEGHSTYAGGFAAAQQIAGRGLRPDAIFAVNDIMAMGVIDALRRTGLRVPEDVSVTGFDDIHAASWPNYDLTTVAQPVDAMIERALDLLLARIEDSSRPGEDISIHGELRRRASARLPDKTASLQ